MKNNIKKSNLKKEKNIVEITEAVDIHKGNKFGILTIQNYVNRNRNTEDKVSFYRVRKTITAVLGLTYKRANVVNKVMTQSDRQRRFFESSMIQLYFDEQKVEVIYIDEASWNYRN